jgi:DNA-binding Lrp family transcriptional regulator
MIRKNVIIGYRAVIDEQKIGFIKFKLIIKLKSVDSQDYNKLFTYFLIQKNTQYVKTCFGQWDLSATILTKDILELKDIVSQIRTDLKESLEECKTLILYEEHKNNYFPEGIVRYIRIPTEKRKLTKQSTTPTKYQ